MKQRHSFTLTEMLVVVFITVLLMGLTVPAIRWLGGGERIDQAAWKVHTALTQARIMAIRYKCNIAITFPGKTEESIEKNLLRLVQVERIYDDQSSYREVASAEFIFPKIELPPHIVVSYVGVSKIPTVGIEQCQRILMQNGDYQHAIIFKRDGSIVGLQQFVHLAHTYQDRIRLDYDMRMLKVNQYNGQISIIDPEKIEYQ